MKQKAVPFLLAFLIGSSAAKATEPPIFWSEVKRAEAHKDYRLAIYYLCMIELELSDKESSELSTKLRHAKLEQIYLKAGLPEKAKKLTSLKNERELKTFFENEMDAAAPRTIAEYADGTLAIYRPGTTTPAEVALRKSKKELEPPICGIWDVPIIVRPSDSRYKTILHQYWWYHLPKKSQLAKRQKFIPSEHIGPTPMGGIKLIPENH